MATQCEGVEDPTSGALVCSEPVENQALVVPEHPLESPEATELRSLVGLTKKFKADEQRPIAEKLLFLARDYPVQGVHLQRIRDYPTVGCVIDEIFRDDGTIDGHRLLTILADIDPHCDQI